ncbi:MAG: glutamate-5-semialdehyde dehydrogenase [Lachnospiraceae bacterium]|nr:glutamate-5-semialdehyde dehydrogenase [Lachnospiraceae bacterium]
MTDFTEMGKKAIQAKGDLIQADTEAKNRALLSVADALVANAEEILAANEEDLKRGREKGMKEGLLDRLKLDEKRIAAMAEGVREVAALPDPDGEVLETFLRPNGMEVQKVRVPLGVIGIIYESRPNVTADAFSLCFKSGNVTVLKGGSDAISSNIAIAGIIRRTLEENGITPDALQLIADTDREVTKEFMRRRDFIDVLIPRGSASLIRTTVEESRIPVIETGTGNCHVYVDRDADLSMALDILINAKTQRNSVCNAAESLVVHEAVAEAFLPEAFRALTEHGVEIRADAAAKRIMKDARVKDATEEDFATEYLDAVISVNIVKDLAEAIAHINRYHTKHSDCIVTKDQSAAERFLREIDSACVYHNVSTRFTDGFEFGFGAEIGISTQMLHARGPMGLRELTTYKYRIRGNGQIRH